MFEQLLEEPYPDDEIGVGNGCLGLEHLRAIGSNPMEVVCTECVCDSSFLV